MKLASDPSYPQQDQFCHCFGDYLGDLLTDEEIAYVVQELAASDSILEKQERVNATCNAMTPLQ